MDQIIEFLNQIFSLTLLYNTTRIFFSSRWKWNHHVSKQSQELRWYLCANIKIQVLPQGKFATPNLGVSLYWMWYRKAASFVLSELPSRGSRFLSGHVYGSTAAECNVLYFVDSPYTEFLSSKQSSSYELIIKTKKKIPISFTQDHQGSVYFYGNSQISC